MPEKRLRKRKSIVSGEIAKLASSAKSHLSETVRLQHVEVLKLPEEYSDISGRIDNLGYCVLRTGYRLEEYCRAVSGENLQNRRTKNVSDLILLLCEKAETILNNVDMGFICRVPREPLFVDIDEEKFYFAVLEIILNAVQNSPSGTRIKLNVSSTKKFVKITVSDKGSGMDEETAEHCFEPFFIRGGESKNGKMGLGLTLARHFAVENGGRMNIKTEKGKGTSVSVLLPLAEYNKAILTAEAASKDIFGGKFSPVCIMLCDIAEEK